MIDLITLLVDKSLVNAEYTSGPTRYGLLETVRQYALEKLGKSGEADVIRTRHRDHYNAAAAKLDAPRVTDMDRRVDWADGEIDNLRGRSHGALNSHRLIERWSWRRLCIRCG